MGLRVRTVPCCHHTGPCRVYPHLITSKAKMFQLPNSNNGLSIGYCLKFA